MAKVFLLMTGAASALLFGVGAGHSQAVFTIINGERVAVTPKDIKKMQAGTLPDHLKQEENEGEITEKPITEEKPAPARSDFSGRMRAMDTNQDGYVNKEEFTLRAEGASPHKINSRFNQMDINNDGRLSRLEQDQSRERARTSGNYFDPVMGQ